jgi:hypothetical protein
VLAFALSIRLCPLPAIREELWMRLTAAGVLGEAGGLRWRLPSLQFRSVPPVAAATRRPAARVPRARNGSVRLSIRRYDRIGRIWLAMTIPMMVLVCLRWLAVFAGVNLVT